jgi:predicted DNA-binding transcriptional regulator AlpA
MNFSLSYVSREDVFKARGVSLSTQLRDEKLGVMPIPISTGRSVRFIEHEVRACMAAEANGSSTEQQQALVNGLIGIRRYIGTATEEEMRKLITDLVVKHTSREAEAAS